MKHLNPEEFVDFLDGTLAGERSRHVDACAACRRQADALRAMTIDIRAVEVPEPSPLFWDHLSARVRRAAVEPATAASSWRTWREWRTWRAWGLAAAMAVVVLALIVGSREMNLPGARIAGPGGDAADGTMRSGNDAGDLAGDLNGSRLVADDSAEPAWALVLEMAEAVEWDEDAAVELVSHGRGSERAFFRLSAEERVEFARILEDELAAVRARL